MRVGETKHTRLTCDGDSRETEVFVLISTQVQAASLVSDQNNEHRPGERNARLSHPRVTGPAPTTTHQPPD